MTVLLSLCSLYIFSKLTVKGSSSVFNRGTDRRAQLDVIILRKVDGNLRAEGIKNNLSLLRPEQNKFADDKFECIVLDADICILIQMSLKFVYYVSYDNKPAIVLVTACVALNRH